MAYIPERWCALLALTLLIVVPGCRAQEGCLDPVVGCSSTEDYFPVRLVVEEMRGVSSWEYSNTHVDLTIVNETGAERAYRLVRCGCESVAPSAPASTSTISIPRTNVFVSESPTMFLFLELDALDHISMVKSASAMFAQELQDAVISGSIADVPEIASIFNTSIVPVASRPSLALLGESQIADYEANPSYSSIPSLPILASQEKLPLGRAEWIKVVGLLTGEESAADAMYNGIQSRYRESSRLANSVRRQPSVAWGQPFGDPENGYSWSTLAADSYPRQLIRDANAVYRDLNGTGDESTNLFLNLTEGAAAFSSADYWLSFFVVGPNATQGTTQDMLAILGLPNASVPVYFGFESVACGNVWASTKRLRANGTPFPSSDFFESAVVRPDLVLRDMVKLLHPSLEIEDDFFYMYNVEKAVSGPTIPECPLTTLPSEPDGGMTYVTAEIEFGMSRFDVEDRLVDHVHPAIARASGITEANFESQFDPSSTEDTSVMETTLSVDAETDLEDFTEMLRDTLPREISQSLQDSGVTGESAEVTVKDVVFAAQDSSGISGGAAAGIAIGTVLAIAALVLAFSILWRNHKAQQMRDETSASLVYDSAGAKLGAEGDGHE